MARAMSKIKKYWNDATNLWLEVVLRRNLVKYETVRVKIGNEFVKDRQQKAFNRINTNEYTLLTFLPLNLLRELMRFANFYFLILTIISYFLVDCPISPTSTMIPLIVVVTVAINKQIPEFYFRRKADEAVNNTNVNVIRQGQETMIEAQFIAPGDLLVIKEHMNVPCDLVILQTTLKSGKCFVSTANLDGETNLKTLHVPHGLPPVHCNDLNKLGIIECEAPNTDLYKFNGKLETASQTIALSTDNILLQGAHIANTNSVIGCAVYVGMATKLQLNSRLKNHKISTSEHYINVYVIGLVVLMLLVVIFLYLMQRYDEISVVPTMPQLGPPIDVNTFAAFFNEFFSYLVLFSYMIPLPLYAVLEVYRVLNFWFIRWDLKLYDEATDQPCIARTSDLNEELGQINVVMSDKTGTLTKNEMRLQQCTIKGQKFLCKGSHLQAPNCDDILTIGEFDLNQLNFFLALTICHTLEVVSAEVDVANLETVLNMDSLDDAVKYSGSSSDEKALVAACADLGFLYLGDEQQMLRIRLPKDELCYKRLHILEFTSERKRMSVIVEDSLGNKWIYTKGADSSVLPLCINDDNDSITKTDLHSTEFSTQGLRTLVIARRRLDAEEYVEFLNIEQLANDLLSQQNEIKAKAYALVERDLEVLGATAVEDKLQDDVTSTLVSLRLASIQVWVLTGDKLETAVNTSIACGHIPSDTAAQLLTNCSNKTEALSYLDSVQEKMSQGVKCALVVDSESLQLILAELPTEFRNVALSCMAVLCCRLSPLQKSQLVDLVKSSPLQCITAAIGDGANDVSMLRAAHVGIAVMGKEGRQAIAGADFAIAKFNMLKRLLLVHGHFSVKRLSLLVLYYFYENIIIIGPMFLFQFYNMHSGTSVYNWLFLALYTTLYNSLPAMVISFTEKPYTEESLMKYPELYTRISHYRTLNWPVFLMWTINGFLHSLNIYISFFLFISSNDVILSNGQPAGFSCFGTIIMQCVVIVSNLKLLIESKYISYWYLGALAFSLLAFVVSTILGSVINSANNTDEYWTYIEVFSSLPVWLFTILTTIACLMADFGLRYMRESFKLPQTWSFAHSGFVRTLQDWNILRSEDIDHS